MRSTPVLFLDIDGVLNTPATKAPPNLVGEQEQRLFGFSKEEAHLMLERELVARLSGLVTATRCDVVFHSSWIYSWTTPELARFLALAGFEASCGFDSTVKMGGREARIDLWLEANGLRPFAVLDDCCAEREFPTKARRRLVAVAGEVGLQSQDVSESARLLRKPCDSPPAC